MSGIEILGAVLGLAGSAVGAAGSIAQGQAQQDAAEYNQRVLKMQADQEREAANAEALDYKRQEHRKLASAQAARGAAGVAVGSGSPLLVDEATVREIALGTSRISYGGNVKRSNLLNEAELERVKGENAMTAAYWGAGSSLLSGFSSIYGSIG